MTNGGKSYWSTRIHFSYKGRYFYLFNKGLASNHCEFRDYLIPSNLIQSLMLQPVAERNACPFLSAGAISGCPGNTAKAAPAELSTTYRLHRPIKRKDGVTREFFAIWWAEIGRAVATAGEESARNAEFARPRGRGDKDELRGVRPSGWAEWAAFFQEKSLIRRSGSD